jgi:hypothetical protein
VENCLDGPAGRRVCETRALCGGANGVATGCCSSLLVLAVEAGVPDASTVGASAPAVGPSADGDTPADAAVGALEGAAVGVSDAAVVVRLEGAAIDSGAAVDSGAPIVAFG